MKRAIVFLMAALLLFSAVGCGKKGYTEQDIEDRAQQAKDLVAQLESGDFSAAFAQFDKNMQAALPQATLTQQWAAVHTQYGMLKEHLSYTAEQAEGYLRIVLLDRFTYSALNISVVFDANHKVAGLYMAEAHNVDDGRKLPEGLVEEDVTVTTGDYKLPGKLTMPKEGDKLPAVVIVHGSGPSDMDGSVNNLKPYRDIAWGLAQEDIAVLRYDKRTLVYAQSMASDQTLTVNEESIDDAVSAVQLLRANNRIDASRVYVLGHSLGGTLLPCIQQKANANGLIFLAASARGMADQYERQMEYLTNLAVQDGSATREQADATMAQVRATVSNIRGLTADSKLTADQLMGVPKAYWLDLAAYDPVKQARDITVPMLFLQGERDYQVTMDDFAMWQTLSDKKNATFVSIKAVGHMFTPGSEIPSPQDYRTEYIPFDSSAIEAMASFVNPQ